MLVSTFMSKLFRYLLLCIDTHVSMHIYLFNNDEVLGDAHAIPCTPNIYLFNNDEVLGDAHAIPCTLNNSVGLNTVCMLIMCLVFLHVSSGSCLKTA